MELIAPADAVFLLGESREHPMHVGALQLFDPPAGAGPDFVHTLYETLAAADDPQPTFRKRPGRLFGGISSLSWSYDRDIDMDYHVRRSALPQPCRIRELLELTSLLHSGLLDRHRPLWEQHIVEGLADGRFAIYTKLHHALIDGISAQRLLIRSLSTEPDGEIKVPWTLRRPPRDAVESNGGASPFGAIRRAVRGVAGMAPGTLALARAALDESQGVLRSAAPRSMFNVPIGGARRCAAQSWPRERIRAVKQATGVTINDVVLAMCSAALRAYLLERDALPDDPLIAMVPVSLRSEHEADAGGNMVGAILCNLATDVADPIHRLALINSSMRSGKEIFAQLPRAQALALSAVTMSPLALAAVPGFVNATKPPFNLVISNVPGPREPMYWQGARLDGNYPLSIALDGQALNITLADNAGNLDFGIVGCRRSVPHLQRLLLHLEEGLSELEDAVGVATG
ncbi:WS/DGAT/MGAT family O-acyltransferase [Nocardia puris]|uniref:Diacylglycerol O-acyltransferase n=1 Tax=Nocardia puris TaxID=208602 RepID=A0A366DUM7_9NOCA|nr:wax ester/triacylglycerol synthase family O-acyltransferase [Nocardia puris]RBO93615.1 diacylglycerol O-acyltransferase [Nocardia puris]